MKNFFKNKWTKRVFALSVIAVALTASAATYIKVQNANAPSSTLVVGPGRLNSIQIYNPTATATVVYFYDSGTSNYTYAVGAFTNYTTSTFTGTSIYTNFFGRTNTNTFSYKSNVVQNVAAASYTNRLINVLAIPAATTVSSTLVSPLMFGLMYTNTVIAASNLVITADINPTK